MGESKNSKEVMNILSEAKVLAQCYRNLTGKPLGITGEIAGFEATGLLGLELTDARQAGSRRDSQGERRGTPLADQGTLRPAGIKTRPAIRIGKEFDGVLLVLMDESFNTTAIYEADREPVIATLTAPGSKARNKRGALAVSKFKAIGKQVWPETE